jgi:hypothetical protein
MKRLRNFFETVRLYRLAYKVRKARHAASRLKLSAIARDLDYIECRVRKTIYAPAPVSPPRFSQGVASQPQSK